MNLYTHCTLGLALSAALVTGCGMRGTDDSVAVPAGTPPTRDMLASARVAYADDGLPFMVSGYLGSVARPIANVGDVDAALAHALPALAKTFQVNVDELTPASVQHDDLGMTHIRYAQRKNGLRVVGSDFVVHIGADRAIRSVNGTARDGGALPVAAAVSVDAARDIARTSTENGNVDAVRSELVYVIATGDGAMQLAWEVEVLGRNGLLVDDLVYVDAAAGTVVDRLPQVFTARNREIRDGNDCTYPSCTGTVVGTEASPPTGDAVALAAFTNTGATYDCYSTLFGRDSYDAAGGKLRSTVHVLFQGTTGATGNNAAWTGNQMVYGDGDGQMMTPLANSLDVTAHELTHGVTAATAGLAYRNESGALNEGMSDIMAAVCESWKDGAVSADTWLVGEDIFTPGTAGDALRYMANPTADAALYPASIGGSRDFYAERYQGTQDNGGVHLNSGIPNLAFQLLVVGGKHPRNKTTVMVPALGIQKAGAIFQRALTQGYFTSNTNFAQARTQTEMVATQLYPGAAVTAVGMAWAAVGIGTPPTPSDTTPPAVEIVSPTDGATVEASFEVTVQATDDVGVERVELTVDGAVIGSDSAAPYTFTTSDLATGSHTITATAYDLFNHASDTNTVVVASSGGSCQAATDCSTGEQCKDGTCVGSCTSDSDCPSGDTCTAGVCETPGASETDDGGGCGCATGDRDVPWSNLGLLVGVLFLARRRRR